MPFQNRVTPTGELIAVSARGELMGNRGRLHNSSGEIIKDTDRKAWIYCALEFKGRKQEVMAPGRYTQLFFLDEATALAAGHRPCATCQRAYYNNYTAAFKKAQNVDSINDIDEILKEHRVWVREEMHLSQVPAGAFVLLSDDPATWLVWNEHLFRWSPAGYCEQKEVPNDELVQLITPLSTVNVLKQGYIPRIHLSIKGLA